MTDPIRVLHFADVHIGMENYGKTDAETGLSTRVRDFLRRMDEMIEIAAQREVDLTIFAGDAFKTRTPNPTYQREFAYRVRDLAALAPVVLLVGNHDLPPTLLKASSIEIYDTLAVHNVWVANSYSGRVIETRRGPVYVGAAPYPMRSHLLEGHDTTGKTIADTDQMLQHELAVRIDTLGEEAETQDMPRILTGHFTASGAAFGSERGIMLGRDVQVLPSTLADGPWDYVALGHIHKHQNLTEGLEGKPPVVYSGSLERIDFGEEADVKGFCWVELKRGQTTWSFEPVPARPFVTLRADLRQSDDPTHEVLALIERRPLRDAIVRVLLDLTPETETRFNEGLIRDALRRAGVSVIAAIRKEIEQPARARLGTSPEELTDLELLERFLISKQTPPERIGRLLEKAQDIFDRVQSADTITV